MSPIYLKNKKVLGFGPLYFYGGLLPLARNDDRKVCQGTIAPIAPPPPPGFAPGIFVRPSALGNGTT